jgi:hypothetical protein
MKIVRYRGVNETCASKEVFSYNIVIINFHGNFVVPRVGIEPPILGFSVATLLSQVIVNKVN